MEEFTLYQNDSAMLYETLLRRVYHCGRCNDPFGLADTDMYNRDGNGLLQTNTLVGIWTALFLLASQINDPIDQKKIKTLKNRFEKKTTELNFKEICKELFPLIDKWKINEFPHSTSLNFKL